MNRLGLAAPAAAIVAAAGATIVGVGLRLRPIEGPVISAAFAADRGVPIYFQDPDGKPFYSLTPRKTADGRDYRAVPAGADVSFDDEEHPPAVAPDATNAGASGVRKIKYYRNPMGLPDTSLVPKKDPMGMDYIPVYEGDDSDDGAGRVTSGKHHANEGSYTRAGQGKHPTTCAHP